MPEIDRRNAMMMAGLSVAAVAIPTPKAGADPGGPEAPGPVPPAPPAPDAPPAPAAAVPEFLGDEFNGPAGAPPNPALWQIAQFRESIKNPVFWDRPENMGQYRDDGQHVFLDGNGNLVIRATRGDDGRYVSGKIVGTFGAGINHTFEARVKFNCLTAGCWPAWWLLNDNPERGGEVDIAEWYGNMDWPSGTTVHARLDGTSFATQPFPVDSLWHTWRVTWNDSGMYFWRDYKPGMEPYFTVPAFSIDDWPFNDPGYELRPVFNLAVGGSGGRDPRPGKYPAEMLVDWVRIY
jgi:hypothetical protein